MEVVASLSQGRTAAAQCGLFTHKSVPVIFEPSCISQTLPFNARLKSQAALMYLGIYSAPTVSEPFPNNIPTTTYCSKTMTNTTKPTLTEPTHFLHIQQCRTDLYESQYKVWYKSSKCYFGTVMSLSSEDSSYSLLCCSKDIECNRFPSVLLLLLLLLLFVNM